VPVGYSDHTTGNEISFAAVAMGAVIIEKHFTLDKGLEGPDHKASINPAELKDLVQGIRKIEQAMSGSGLKQPQPDEMETRLVVRKGIYTGKALEQGQQIIETDLKFKRPVADGIDASLAQLVIGRRTRHRLDAAHLLTLNDIQ
jgi:sialic acid synthase SpsE